MPRRPNLVARNQENLGRNTRRRRKLPALHKLDEDPCVCAGGSRPPGTCFSTFCHTSASCHNEALLSTHAYSTDFWGAFRNKAIQPADWDHHAKLQQLAVEEDYWERNRPVYRDPHMFPIRPWQPFKWPDQVYALAWKHDAHGQSASRTSKAANVKAADGFEDGCCSWSPEGGRDSQTVKSFPAVMVELGDEKRETPSQERLHADKNKEVYYPDTNDETNVELAALDANPAAEPAAASEADDSATENTTVEQNADPDDFEPLDPDILAFLLRTRLAIRGLTTVANEGLGDCVYLSLAEVFGYPDDMRAAIHRELAGPHSYRYRSYFTPGWARRGEGSNQGVRNQSTYVETYEQYTEAQAREGTWANDIVIQAAANLFAARIDVFTVDRYGDYTLWPEGPAKLKVALVTWDGHAEATEERAKFGGWAARKEMRMARKQEQIVWEGGGWR